MQPEPDNGPGELYTGEITDQLLTTGLDNEVQLILTVSLTGLVGGEKDPAGAATARPPEEVEVWLKFSASNARLDIPLGHLTKLGYTDADLSRLHPDNPGCHLLTGTKVHVRPKWVNGLPYWNLAWPRAKPKATALGEVKGVTAALATAIAAARAAKSGPVTAPRPAAGGEG